MVKPLKTRTKRKGGPVSIKLSAIARALVLSVFPYFLSLAVLGGLAGGAFAFAVNSPTFGLREVRVLNAGSLTSAQAFSFCELRPGENLVTIDLVEVQQVIKRRHPEFKEVRVRRVLPDRVDVVLKRRTPAAQMDFGRFVQIDKDLVLLPGSSTGPFRNLTVIEGAKIPKPGLYVGVSVTDDNAKKALKLIEVLRQSEILRGHPLTKIDVKDPNNLSLIVDGDVEIRIGGGHFIERLKILDQTLKSVGLDREKIRYIDLRFDDVVIGPR